jgi:hypothetical protein
MSAAQAREAGKLWAGTEAAGQTQGDAKEGTVGQRATRAQEAKRVLEEIVGTTEQAVPSSPVAPDLLTQAAKVSAEVAQGILDRVQALLGDGSGSKPGATQATEQREPNASTRGGEQQEAQRRDADQHMTLDALNEALRALSQAPTGDQPMANGAAGDGSQNNGRSNISGGAMGMRVNTTEAGPGGADTPPEAPTEGLGEPVLGKPTLRLAAQAQRVGASALPEETRGTDEGFYVATQVQAARLGLTAAPALQRSVGEAALAREQVPVPYRASVKRYFLIEHGKEH